MIYFFERELLQGHELMPHPTQHTRLRFSLSFLPPFDDEHCIYIIKESYTGVRDGDWVKDRIRHVPLG